MSGKAKRRPLATSHPFFKAKHLVSPIAGKTPDEAKALFQSQWNQKNYKEAREIALAFIQVAPHVAQAWSDVAVCALMLEDWHMAIEYGKKAYALDARILATIDAVAHAYGGLHDYVNAGIWGHKALTLRNQMFGQKFFAPWQSAAILPLSTDKSRNVIAFSLFGNNPKYCEVGLMNVVDCPQIYPQWTCRFYVDETVPVSVKERLIKHGAQVVEVDEVVKQWPAPMWRFAAYDDASLDRVLFRDADSVISKREADAVAEWVVSEKPFHHMRDSGSHTELILAGLWGVVVGRGRGALPRMSDMIADFLKAPLRDSHFADQYFLREYVWPYMRGHVLQHDSLFGFLEPRPFPEGGVRTDFHTGCRDSGLAEVAVDKPEGTTVYWAVYERVLQNNNSSGVVESLVCRYPLTVSKGAVRCFMPKRYLDRLASDYLVRIEDGAEYLED